MGYGFKLKLFGDYACFTRPEFKVERVSYDVITPSAARGIIEAIYWKPSIRWVVDRIHVLNEIKFTNIRRNEVSDKIAVGNIIKIIKNPNADGNTVFCDVSENRQQRAALLLKDVCYLIEFHFEITEKAGDEETEQKHYNIALRRMREGQCFYQPYFGTREFPVNFELIENDECPKGFYSHTDEIDLGWMLWDIDFSNNMSPVFYRAKMKKGIIDVKACRNEVKL